MSRPDLEVCSVVIREGEVSVGCLVVFGRLRVRWS
jgi:hypothetical protein